MNKTSNHSDLKHYKALKNKHGIYILSISALIISIISIYLHFMKNKYQFDDNISPSVTVLCILVTILISGQIFNYVSFENKINKKIEELENIEDRIKEKTNEIIDESKNEIYKHIEEKYSLTNIKNLFDKIQDERENTDCNFIATLGLFDNFNDNVHKGEEDEEEDEEQHKIHYINVIIHFISNNNFRLTNVQKTIIRCIIDIYNIDKNRVSDLKKLFPVEPVIFRESKSPNNES
ncbi:hypothetical protein IR083_20830 [Dysgonomonas sp. GY75]|uniref:hypothetical protein n=1 Tax=Dysgonomonas sp. GY75 TaxID=2780419 RepID=UPI0018844AFF|nr:hypothetical protein [Dysgonomonas sp. GY75]MBF0651267.1 hypothetical protein [Dysgonomonas sp. GY75]